MAHRVLVVRGAGVLLAAVAIVLAVLGSRWAIAPAAVGGPGLLLLAGRWAVGARRERRIRATAARGVRQIEELLVSRRCDRVNVGGVAELCPTCGRPVNPVTARCGCR